MEATTRFRAQKRAFRAVQKPAWQSLINLSAKKSVLWETIRIF